MKHPFVSRRRLFLLEERRAGQKNLSFRRAIDTLFLWQDAARRMDDETFLAFQHHTNRASPPATETAVSGQTTAQAVSEHPNIKSCDRA